VNVRLDTGEPVVFGHVLAKAGEGTIYEIVGRTGWAAKVFHPTLGDLGNKLDKVAAMIHTSPRGTVQPNGFVVLTWPLHTLLDGGTLIGYVMPRIDTSTAVEIHTIANPSNRREPPPNTPQWIQHATWDHLVNAAANLCLAVEVVHRVDAVIGDFQERNILICDTTEVTLVDCDSMQFTDEAGRQFLCRVGRPEFTAPELAGVDLGTQRRAQPSDLFALAVHIHQLLMAGNHPFMRGTWTGAGEQPDAIVLAQQGHWAGGPSSLLRTHPLAPPVAFLPGELQQLFSRAFTVGAHDPAQRPTAGEWRAALLRIRLRSCPRGEHRIPVSCLDCPWCRIADERTARRQTLGAGPRGATGPLKVMPRDSTAARPIARPGARGPAQGVSAPRSAHSRGTRIYLAVLVVVVIIVVALASFIVWAVLTGRSSFGAAADPGSVQAPTAVNTSTSGVRSHGPPVTPE
jgi:DNA-binding helix-hairpin-helix protein with protein kinase domain